MGSSAGSAHVGVGLQSLAAGGDPQLVMGTRSGSLCGYAMIGMQYATVDGRCHGSSQLRFSLALVMLQERGWGTEPHTALATVA